MSYSGLDLGSDENQWAVSIQTTWLSRKVPWFMDNQMECKKKKERKKERERKKDR